MLEFEGWKGIQSSQQLGHFVGQKVLEIEGWKGIQSSQQLGHFV